LIGILGFIWGNSLLPAEISQAFSDWVKALLFPASGGEIQTGSGLLRKIAHFTEFTALGMALGWLFAMLEKKMYCPLLLGMAVACVDETIQHFVPGRSPGIRDIAIDTAGVAVGIGLLVTGYHLYKKRKQYLLLEENNT
jgi:VanZ family protein